MCDSSALQLNKLRGDGMPDMPVECMKTRIRAISVLVGCLATPVIPVKRRIDEVESGTAKLIPADEVLARLRRLPRW